MRSDGNGRRSGLRLYARLYGRCKYSTRPIVKAIRLVCKLVARGLTFLTFIVTCVLFALFVNVSLCDQLCQFKNVTAVENAVEKAGGSSGSLVPGLIVVLVVVAGAAFYALGMKRRASKPSEERKPTFFAAGGRPQSDIIRPQADII